MCISKCFENARVHVRITWQKFRKPFQEFHSELRNTPFCGPSRTMTWSQKLLIDIHKQLIIQNTYSYNNNNNKTFIKASCRGKMETKHQEKNYQALFRWLDLYRMPLTDNCKCIMAGFFFL